MCEETVRIPKKTYLKLLSEKEVLNHIEKGLNDIGYYFDAHSLDGVKRAMECDKNGEHILWKDGDW